MDVQSPNARAMNISTQPHIVFRSDASVEIGTGHIMRCLSLADSLKEMGARCTFICRPHKGHLIKLIIERGHIAKPLPKLEETEFLLPSEREHTAWLGTDWSTDAQDSLQVLDTFKVDWLVVDHYALDWRWEGRLRTKCDKVMVIDDLANRRHDCDVLLDQNLMRSAKDYVGLLKPHTNTLLGQQFSLIHPEFAQLRSKSLARRDKPQLNKLLVTMGGVDRTNATVQVLEALSTYNFSNNLQINVVMGPHAPWLNEVEQQAKKMPYTTKVLVGINYMAQLMTESDLCIGASGSTSWERCCLGLPTIVLILAENQRTIGNSLELVGAAVVADLHLLSSDKGLISKCFEVNHLISMSKKAALITDGLGTQRISMRLLKEAKVARKLVLQ